MFYLTNFIFQRNLVSSRRNAVFTTSRREVQTPEQKPTLTAVSCCATLVGNQQRRRSDGGLGEGSPERHTERHWRTSTRQAALGPDGLGEKLPSVRLHDSGLGMQQCGHSRRPGQCSPPERVEDPLKEGRGGRASIMCGRTHGMRSWHVPARAVTWLNPSCANAQQLLWVAPEQAGTEERWQGTSLALLFSHKSQVPCRWH